MPRRLIVHRIPDFNAEKHRASGQSTLFDLWRLHTFFTTTKSDTLNTVDADKLHWVTRPSRRSTPTSKTPHSRIRSMAVGTGVDRTVHPGQQPPRPKGPLGRMEPESTDLC